MNVTKMQIEKIYTLITDKKQKIDKIEKRKLKEKQEINPKVIMNLINITPKAFQIHANKYRKSTNLTFSNVGNRYEDDLNKMVNISQQEDQLS